MSRRSVGWMGVAAIALTVALLLGYDWNNSGLTRSSFQIAQEAPTDIPELTAAEPAISGTYEDPQGNFQIGILDGYGVSSMAGSPLFQSLDGGLAYSVVTVPLETDAPLSDIGLVDLAQTALSNGEGFQTQTFTPVSGGGLQISWSGRFSQGTSPSQPISGVVLAKQQGGEAYLLVVAALEEADLQVAQVVSTLASTLTLL
ncbi:hypothetical protein PN498_24265 [Oscillatoria sp. CS-180]|uniref:hypothetical protein n=1 Tax=Oscillatoria sp. CS-180 TaxID=3021720 RepID=UPI00232CCC9E|nr:hypothetical protein [Oscillatoria sp. CS-180]MDB9529129.1 hypothetical protein [Oscillatoria sp. CS-180]